MYEYFYGKITRQIANYIVVDVSGVGYKLFTPNPYRFKENEEYKVYAYNHVREDENSDPSNMLLDKEESSEIIERIRAKLSESENEIFELRLKGLSNSEIAALLDKDKKIIENTMYRINKKYKELFKE